MEARGEVRYDLLTAARTNVLDAGALYLELEFDRTVRAVPVDISPRGLGFEIPAVDNTLPQYYAGLQNFILRLHCDGDFIVAGVKTAWHRLFAEGSRMVLRGGVQIDVISPEDRLKLSAIIERVRSSSRE